MCKNDKNVYKYYSYIYGVERLFAIQMRNYSKGYKNIYFKKKSI